METRIEDIFVKDIKRPLNPVIKVNDLEDSALYQELDEYVVTKDIDKNFEKLYKAIIKGFAGGGGGGEGPYRYLDLRRLWQR